MLSSFFCIYFLSFFVVIQEQNILHSNHIIHYICIHLLVFIAFVPAYVYLNNIILDYTLISKFSEDLLFYYDYKKDKVSRKISKFISYKMGDTSCFPKIPKNVLKNVCLYTCKLHCCYSTCLVNSCMSFLFYISSSYLLGLWYILILFQTKVVFCTVARSPYSLWRWRQKGVWVKKEGYEKSDADDDTKHEDDERIRTCEKGRGNQFVETTKRSLMSASEKTKNFYIHIHNRHIWENESGESCCHTIRNSDITYLPHYPHQLPPPPLPFNRKNSEITSHGKLLKILLTPFRSSH